MARDLELELAPLTVGTGPAAALWRPGKRAAGARSALAALRAALADARARGLGPAAAWAAALLLAVGLVALAAAAHGNRRTAGPPDAAPCLAPACIQLAAEVFQTVDESVDPCEDFYHYACNGFLRKHPIPDDKSSWVSFNVLAESNRRLLRSALEGEGRASSAVPVALAREVYAACMDEEAVETKGTPVLQSMLDRVDTGVHGVSSAIANAHAMGVSALFALGVGTDDKQPTRNAVFLSQGGLGLPSREYYLNDRHEAHRRFYLTYVERILALAEVKLKSGNASKAAADVLDLETELARAHLPRAELRDPLAVYNIFDVASLGNSTPLAWDEVIGAQTKLAGVEMPSTLVVSIPAYPEKVNELLSSRSANGHEAVQAYLSAHAAMKAAPLLGAAFADLDMEYRRRVYGIASPPPRWEKCVGVTESVLGFAVGRLFVDTAFSAEANAEASEDVAFIRKSFERAVPQATWMDEPTRTRALGKAAATRSMIGVPPMVTDDALLSAHYAETIEEMHLVANRSGNLLETIMAANKGGHRRSWAKLEKLVDRTEWDMFPQEVNAYYDPTKNDIVFPAGILQPPFFRLGAPRAANLGGIGVVVGHELSHGFDDQGRQYDADGALKNWWSKESEHTFQRRAQCIVRQYSRYRGFEGSTSNVDGNLTLGENLADNVGLHLSWQAYERWRETHGEDSRLPVPGLTNDMLFFLSFARVWCGATRPETAERRLLTDPHSPSKWRVIGTLQNSRAFAEAYGCKTGSTMNPVDKCDIYD